VFSRGFLFGSQDHGLRFFLRLCGRRGVQFFEVDHDIRRQRNFARPEWDDGFRRNRRHRWRFVFFRGRADHDRFAFLFAPGFREVVPR